MYTVGFLLFELDETSPPINSYQFRVILYTNICNNNKRIINLTNIYIINIRLPVNCYGRMTFYANIARNLMD